MFAVLFSVACRVTTSPSAKPTVHSFQILLKKGIPDSKAKFQLMKDALASKGFSTYVGPEAEFNWTPSLSSRLVERITYIQNVQGGRIYFVIASFENEGISADAILSLDVEGNNRERDERAALKVIDEASAELKSIS
jgi:hypothetical protein